VQGVAEEVIAHLVGQAGADVTVRLEIAADLPKGASDQVVRTVTENSKTLKFDSHGFEKDYAEGACPDYGRWWLVIGNEGGRRCCRQAISSTG
jgi:hypothetical protein